jgi:hypothetical protein
MEAFKGQLDRARGGEPEALSALYRQLLPGVFSLSLTITASASDNQRLSPLNPGCGKRTRRRKPTAAFLIGDTIKVKLKGS